MYRMKYFLAPFLVSLASYYLFIKLAVSKFYDADFYFFTAVKYCISKFVDIAGIEMLADISLRVPYELRWVAQNGNSSDMVPMRSYHKIIEMAFSDGGIWMYNLFGAAAVIGFIGGIYFFISNSQTQIQQSKRRDKILRGTRLISGKEYCRKSHKTVDAGIVIPTHSGKLVLSQNAEKEHFLILGSTGTGKSTLLLSLVKQFMERGTRLIVVDRKGEFYAYFGRKNDALFSPYDSRTVEWDIFREIFFNLDRDGRITSIPPDLQAVADFLYGVNDPKRGRGKNAHWYKAGASVFISAVCWCVLNKKTSTRELLNFLSGNPEKIIHAFEKLPEELQCGLSSLGKKPDGEHVVQVMAMVQEGMQQLNCFAEMSGKWSVREWLNNGSGNLFISTAGRNDTTFLGVVQLLIDLIGREIKEFPDDGEQATKLVILVDELGAYPPIDTLTFLLTQARSKGICVILANQTFERLKEVYGETGARNIVACSKSRFFFALPEPADSKYISELIGNAEIDRRTEGHSENSAASFIQSSGVRLGENLQQHIIQESAVLASEIASLPRGHAVAYLPNMLPDVSVLHFEKAVNVKHNEEYVPVAVHEVSSSAAASLMQFEDENKQEKVKNSPVPELL